MLISRAQATEADALAISANIQALHLPYGTILDPIYAAPNSSQIVDYTRCGDSAIWTGHYLAAEAFRYQVTGSADALNNVKNAVAAINSLIQVTGMNLLARCLVPLNSPYAASIQSQEASNGIYTNSSAGYFWVGNTSRDQYLGVAFGLAVAYDMVNDATVQSSISQIAWLLIGFLTGHDWSVVMPDGSSSTTFLIRPDELLTLLQIGRHVNPGKFDTDYDLDRILLSPTILAPILVDIASDDSYFKFNLDYISFYNLIRLEPSDFKSIYQQAYSVLRSATATHLNGMFDMIDRGLNGPNAARDAEAVGLINAWLQRPSRDNPVNLQNVVPVCGGSACNPIPVVLRPPDEYLWEESPFQLSGGGSGVIEGSGVDYILPYWMARYYGVIQAIEVQSSAAPNGAVTAASLASIYGSNLAAGTQTASGQPPLSLGGVTLTVTDVAGTGRVAPLLYVSSTQINFVVPAGTAAGMAQLSISNGGASPLTTTAIIQSVAPTLFSMSGDGQGVAAAQAIQTTNSNPPVQTAVAVFQCIGSSQCVAVPIALSSNSTMSLVLYGTGVRNRSSLENVTANIGGTNVPVAYAGAQPSYPGLDQVNLTLPTSLSGSGQVNIVLTVDGQTANVVTVDIQ
jgi:uncharacterized protein (TIGR03437 family)